jgi:CheY-like chemotaxis protein
MDALISDTGFNDYILKPYRPAELKKKILQYAPHRKIEYAT